MPIRVECPGCGKGIKAPSKYRGRKISCPGCKEPLLVPEHPTQHAVQPPPMHSGDSSLAPNPATSKKPPLFLSAVVLALLSASAWYTLRDPLVSIDRESQAALPASVKQVRGRGSESQVARIIPRLVDQSLDAAIDGRSDGLRISIEDARELWSGDGWGVLQDRPSETIPNAYTFISKTTDDPRAPWGVVAVGEPGKQVSQLIFTVEIEEDIDPNIIWSVLIGPAGQAAKFSPWSVAELTFWVEVTIREQAASRTHVPVLYRGCRIAGMVENRHFLITISAPFKDEATETWSEWMKKHKR